MTEHLDQTIEELNEDFEAVSRDNDNLRAALQRMIEASDDLTSAIEGATDQFDDEKGRLMDATSAAEKILKGGAA